jgi:probable phosphoglycerate mutase
LSGNNPGGETLVPIAFWFLRHGQTDLNAQNLAQGNRDVPLNATGMEQARTAAALLPPLGIASIVSSPLSRALHTAEAAAAVLHLPVKVMDALHEVDFGEGDGRPMGEPWFEDWVEGRATPEGGESFAALRARAVAAVNQALRENPSPVLIVAHGALFRALRAAMGLPPNVRTQNAVPVLCTPPADGAGPWTLTSAIPGGTPL